MSQDSFVVPVVLCGGSGTRLWPYSREDYPKQFINLINEHFLLRETVERSKRVAYISDNQIVLVSLEDFAPMVREELGGESNHILMEPSPRNTAAAVAYAALYIQSTFGEDAIMWILPADHHIGNEDSLSTALKAGIEVARCGSLVTFGIQPTRPDTGYGYVNIGEPLSGDSVFKVKAFYEKPDMSTAQSYLAEGTYLWNSGMFLFQAKTILSAFERHARDILDGVRAAVEAGCSSLPDCGIYNQIAAHPLDTAIMEKADNVAVIPCDLAWSDIGSWQSLWDLKGHDENGNAAVGRVCLYKTENCLVLGDNTRLIACSGIKNLVVVQTNDALLVADISNADHLKALVGKLKNEQIPEIFSPVIRNS